MFKHCDTLRVGLDELKRLCGEMERELGRCRDLKDRAIFKIDFGEVRRIREEIDAVFERLSGPRREMESLFLVPELKLKEQYEEQARVLRESGLFVDEEFANVNMSGGAGILRGETPVIFRDGVEFPMPDWEQVKKVLKRNKTIVRKKAAQGFTRLLIVPLGHSLRVMTARFMGIVDRLNKNDKIHSADGKVIELEGKDPADFPVRVTDEEWNENNLIYDPEIHWDGISGDTKTEVVKRCGAWQICLVEDMSLLPRTRSIVADRRQTDLSGDFMERDHSQLGILPTPDNLAGMLSHPDEALNPLQYAGERSLKPEQLLWLHMTNLLGKDKPLLIDQVDGEDRGIYLTGAMTKNHQSYLRMSMVFSPFEPGFIYNGTDHNRYIHLCGVSRHQGEQGCGVRNVVEFPLSK